MINRIIEYSIEHKWLVLTLLAFALVASYYAADHIAVDAIPDLSDVQVIVQTEYQGQPPQIVEDQITYPISTALLSVPGSQSVRGYSYFGLSFVYVIFEDGTDIYWARSRVLEYLSQLSGKLPKNVTPQLGPDATSLGWVYQYALVDTTGNHNLAELRSFQDWFLKYELSAIDGVSEVASIGGYVRQYQIEVDPQKLQFYGVSINDVMMAVKNSTSAVGGSILEQAETEFMVRSQQYFGSLDDIRSIRISSMPNGSPLLLSSVAEVQYGPDMRRGVAELDGKGESVGGIIVMRYGENARDVIEHVKTRLSELSESFPAGVKAVTVYDRSPLIDRSIAHLTDTLIVEMIVVVLVLLVFLLHVRSVLIAVATLPAGIGLSLLAMHLLGINANIMSLGGIAIAIGVMIDSAEVTVENAHKHIERDSGKKSHKEIIIDATKEVGPALFFSLMIVTVSFLPVLALEGQSGRLFKPLAYTKTFAMAISAFLAITVIPALTVLFLKGKIKSESQNIISRVCIALYKPVINFALKYRFIVIALTLLILLVTIYPLSKIGTEFIPPLYEGDLLYMPTTLPGISIAKAKELLQQTDSIIASFPEVERVFGKAGRAETATDPAPLTMLETTIKLKPTDQWREGMTPEKLIDSLDRAIQFPGLTNSWTMPIRTRIDMLSTGIKTPLGIKILGPNLDTLNELAIQIEAHLKMLPDIRSVFSERVTGDNYLDVDIDRFKAAAYGLTIADIQETIGAAIGGMNIAYNVEGRERYPISVRYPRELRDNPEAISRMLIATPNGGNVPLGHIAELRFSKGAGMIKSENARPTTWVFIDLKGTDIGTFVKKARNMVESNVTLPAGYSLLWSGQYESIQSVNEKMKVILPLTLFIVVFLLYIHFRQIGNVLIVLLSLPFALVGGVWYFYFLGYNSSVAVLVGFIALAGLAAETGVVMLVYLDEALERYKSQGKLNSAEDLKSAVMEGAVDRVRPKLMTVATTMLALVPIMFGHDTGSEVMQRIAAPMIGGLTSSTILTLIVVPVLYYAVKMKMIIKKSGELAD
ncbi:MAG TPA: CusA/CzcA family heavy metal efflux RND transporter [candidate division Zixibacteria bacterium]|nr:CusA/CzcA family heavy metal efflux RND transporter [candidate division Zixibacteria bacterium]